MAIDARALEDDIILETLARDPERVAREIARVAERLRAQGRHTEAEIETAVMQLQKELGIPPVSH